MNQPLCPPIPAGPRPTGVLRRLSPGLAAALLAVSCSSTKTVSFHERDASHAAPVGSVVTVMLDDRDYLRAAVENYMTGRLKARGVEAYSSHTRIPIQDLKSSKERIREALSVWGAEAVLVSQLTDRSDVSVPPAFVSSDSNWENAWGAPGDSTSFEPTPWGGEVTVTVHLESKLYRVGDAQLLWVGYTQTKVEEFTDDLKRIRTVAREVVDQLAKDGLIR